MFEQKALAGAHVGVVVVDLQTGKTIYERNAAEPLILASNTKLLTTAAALERLGSSHRIETLVHGRGVVDGAVLHGDIVVEGGGDPSFGVRFHGRGDGPLERFARAVRAAGITQVTGDLVLDDRLFDREAQHFGWPADQLDRWYAAPVSALSLNDGCIDVTVTPAARGAGGAAAAVTLEPRCGMLELEVRLERATSADEHVVSIGRRPGANVYVVRGALLPGAAPIVHSVAQWEPALVFGHVLRDRLAEQGVAVGGVVRLATGDDPPPASDPTARPLAIHATLVAEVLPVINKRSQNHYAEMLLKRLGAVCGKGGSFAGGAAVAEAFVMGLGVPDGEVDMVDGSGLARGNRASARAMARLLQVMASHREAAPFVASLAAGGVDGTLARRLRGVDGAERVRAKTGTIRAVSALSGYIMPGPKGGRFLAFSILTNGVGGGSGVARRAQDEAVEVLLGARAAGGAER